MFSSILRCSNTVIDCYALFICLQFVHILFTIHTQTIHTSFIHIQPICSQFVHNLFTNSPYFIHNSFINTVHPKRTYFQNCPYYTHTNKLIHTPKHSKHNTFTQLSTPQHLIIHTISHSIQYYISLAQKSISFQLFHNSCSCPFVPVHS